MKKVVPLLALLIIGLAISLPGIAAKKDPRKSAIKARQGEMQLRAFNAGPLLDLWHLHVF